MLDNVVGAFNDVTANLTSDTISARVLGKSEILTLSNRILIIITVNNFTPAHSMVRRKSVSIPIVRTPKPLAFPPLPTPPAAGFGGTDAIVAYNKAGRPNLGEGSFEMWEKAVCSGQVLLATEL